MTTEMGGAFGARGQIAEVVTVLVSAYFELATEAVDEVAARELSISVATFATEDQLVAVGRAVRDPFPWVPFLRCLHAIPPTMRSRRGELALARLGAVATTMLAH